MKKYKLEDLDLSEKGRTDCCDCPLNDDVSNECSVCVGGINRHLDEDVFDNIPCGKVVVKLKFETDEKV